MTVHPLRALNRSRVLGALMDSDAGLRPELARSLGLSFMAVTQIVRELVAVGLVEEGGRDVRLEPGRRPTNLAIDPSGAYVLGFKLHAFDQSMVLMDLSRRVVRRRTLGFSAPTDGPRSLAELADRALGEIDAVGTDPLRILGAGVVLTGVVDRERGILVDAPYLGWSSLQVAAFLQPRFGFPIVVDRITSALLAAESRTAPAMPRNAIVFNIGFAMNAGFLIDGTIAHGDRLMAGQIGHMPTGDKRRLCSCGQRGCLNVTASGWAALADLGEIDDHVVSAEEFQKNRPQLMDLLRREKLGEPAACQALERAGRSLGSAMRPLQMALDPARIFLAGPVGATRSFVGGAKKGAGGDLAALVVRCEYEVDDAAALMALDAFVRSPRLDFERLRKASAAKIDVIA